MDNAPSSNPVGVQEQKNSPESVQPKAGVAPQQPVQEVPQQSEVPVPQPKSKKWPWLVLVGVVLILIGVGSYFGYQYFQTKKQVSSPASASPTPTADPTAGWETYVNDQYLFSIAYPPEYTVTDNLPQNLSEWEPDKTLSFVNNSIPEKPRLIVEVNADGYGPIFYTKLYDIAYTNKLEVNSKKEIPWENGLGGTPTYTHVGTNAIKVGDNNVNFQLKISGLNETNLESELNQILSTFEFVDQVGSTTGWETYKTPNKKYQISHPPEWVTNASPIGDWDNEFGNPYFTVTMNDYQIKFSFPSGFGPGVCIFSDHPDFTKKLDNEILDSSKCPGSFVEIISQVGLHRRKGVGDINEQQNKMSWGIYTKSQEGHFVTVPPAGYTTPVDYSQTTIKEMDQILSTFTFTE